MLTNLEEIPVTPLQFGRYIKRKYMDTFITVISWIAGFYALFILALTIAFSAGGVANTGNSELGIISIVSTLLFLYLMYVAVSSLFSTDDVKVPPQIKSEKTISTVKIEKEKRVMQVQNTQNENIVLWIFYIFMFLPVPLIVLLFYKKVRAKEQSK